MLWLTVVLLQLKYHSGLLVVSDAGHVPEDHVSMGQSTITVYWKACGRVRMAVPVKYSLKTQLSPNTQLSWKKGLGILKELLSHRLKLFCSPCNIPIPPVLQPLGEYMVQDSQGNW